jgi:hypothetical protein
MAVRIGDGSLTDEPSKRIVTTRLSCAVVR